MNQEENFEKEYYSEELERKLSKIISRNKYGDFALIVREIFHRRAYEFGFSENEIISEAQNFVRNVNNIHFGEAAEFDSPTVMGVYKGGEKTIAINQDFYLEEEKRLHPQVFGDKMFETLTHEVYHAINHMSNEVLGQMYYDGYNGVWRGAALNEIITETAADRTSYGRTSKDAEQYRRDTDGYGSITFATNLLAASLGVTEKEFLKAGVQHRGVLEELVFSKFPQDRRFGVYARDSYMAAFEQSLDTIYNIEYNNNQTQQTPEEYQMKRSLLKGALIGLYEQSYQLANFQISVNPNDVDRRFTAESLHRFSKLEKITADSLNHFAQRYNFSQEEINEIYAAINQPRMDLGTRIVGMDMLQKQGYKITNPAELAIQKEFAKRCLIFESNNITMLNQVYGIEVPRMIGAQAAMGITTDLEYDSYILKEDFDNGKMWDKGDAGIVTRKIFLEDMKRKRQKAQSNNLLKRIMGKVSKTFDPDKTEELPIVDPDKTEELPIVDPDKTEELPIVNDPYKTEPLPIVDNQKIEKSKQDTKGKDSLVSNITKTLKNFFEQIAHRNQKQLPAPKVNNERQDNSSYYAGLVTPEDIYSIEELSFTERIKVAPEDLTPIEIKKEADEQTKKESELSMDL